MKQLEAWNSFICVVIIIHLIIFVLLLTVVRYYHNKFNLTWDEDESHVSYHTDIYYVFDNELSIGDPKDYSITTLNIPLLVS